MRVGMLLADLHFGAVELNQFTEEIDTIIDTIRNTDKLDYIIFLGDLFDHKMYVSDPHIINAIIFIRIIMNMAINRGIKIRMVYGTESHECNQYTLFKGYETIQSLDFKVITKVSEEDLFNDLKVLYVPEEYITVSKSEYYHEYLSKDAEYDYVFGHGVIMEGMIMIKNDQSLQWESAKSPKFTISDFDECLKGEVYFGHFHVNTDIRDRIHYVGSYSRWSHGEEKPKGFVMVTKTDNTYERSFIENDLATIYKTISFGYEHSVFTHDDNIEAHMNAIDKMIAVYPDNSRIRLIFNIPDDYPNPEFFMNYLKEKYRMISRITLDFVNGYIDKKRKMEKETLNSTIKRYDYILKKRDTIGETVSKFIADKDGKDIPPEKVTYYLTQDLQHILNHLQIEG